MPDSRYLLYCRQSVTRGDEGESLSLAAQERALRLMVASRGGIVLEPVIVDADERGWDPNRPGIAEMLARASSERPDVIAVYAVSRFARDNWLAEGIWRRIKEAAPDVRFESVTEPHAEDDLVRGILGVVSQAERKRMGAFLSAAFRERARRGLHHGKVPYGYAKGDDGRLVVNEEARPWVLAIVERLEDGWSLWRVARWLNEQDVGGRAWEPNVVRNMVTAPVIAGGVRTADVETWEAHEPIIDRERWERLGTYLAGRKAIRTKSVSSWLEGLIVCSCGAPLHLVHLRQRPDPRLASGYRSAYGQFRCSADPSRASFQRPRAYPVCASRPRSILQDKAERLAIAQLGAILDRLIDPETVYVRQREALARTAPERERERAALLRQQERAATERDRLLTLYRRGTLDVERWEREDAEIGARLDGIARQIAALPAEPDRRLLARTATTLHGVRELFCSITATAPGEVRQVMRSLDATVRLCPDGLEIVLPPDLAAFVDVP